MPSLFNQLSPTAPPTAAGSPGYESRIVDRTKSLLQPQYKQAIMQARQGLANRGLTRSGIALQTEGQIGENYLGQLGRAANEAAIGSADLAEKNRQRTEERGWQKEDLLAAMEERRNELNATRDIADADRWANLIGGAVGAAANVGGQGLASLLARKKPAVPAAA